MPIANLEHVGPLVARKTPTAITYGDKFATISSSALKPYMSLFDNTEAAKASLKKALSGTQSDVINELKQIHVLFRLFGDDFDLTANVYQRQVQKVYTAEFAIISDGARKSFIDANPTIDIANCNVCLSLNGKIVPLSIIRDDDDEPVIVSVEGYAPKFTVSFAVEKLQTCEIPVYTLMGSKISYTGRVSNYREAKPGIVGMSDRHPARAVLNAIDDYMNGSAIDLLKDFVRTVASGRGKSGVPFAKDGFGIYPVVSLSVDYSADKTFPNTTVVCIGPNGETRYRLSQGQSNMYALSICDSYPSTNELGVTTNPDGLFGLDKLAIAFYDTDKYVSKKGKNAGNEVTRELLTLVPHEGTTFVSGVGKAWDPDAFAFVSEIEQAEKTARVSAIKTEISDDDGDSGESTVIENVFAAKIAETVALIDDKPPTISSKMAKAAKVQAAPAIELDDDEDDDDGASVM
jgi:hypothetical protein